jgi:prepilin-type N-terminal cleavage/methylation domain-containing protein
MNYRQKGFTLIELLIVIGILAVLSTATVLMLNPAQMLAETRDTTRMTDLNTINQALSLFQYYVPSSSFGAANTVYLSLPDTDNADPKDCDEYTILPILSGQTYLCAHLDDYRKVDGTGWIPVDFTQISGDSPLAVLPVDPVNSAAQGLYYSYIGGSWTLNSILESSKYLSVNARSDGGMDDARYETGPKPFLWTNASGLVGYWKMDESSWINDCMTSTVVDSSQGVTPNHGKSCPSLSGPSIVSGKLGNAGNFDGVNDYVDLGSPASLQITGSQTIEMWLYPTSFGARRNPYAKAYAGEGTITQETNGSVNYYYGTSGGNGAIYQGFTMTSPLSLNTWTHLVLVRDLRTLSDKKLYWYKNGFLTNQATASYLLATASPGFPAMIGKGYVSNYAGKIDNVRIYNRALSASEVKAIYNATK